MTPPAGLREAADAYLAMRRALGYKLVTHGRLLMDFVGYCERRQAAAVTTALAVAWARSPADADPYWWTRRLGVVRIFARHLETFDPATEVPAGNLLRTRPRRNVPYVYTSEEISALLDATSMLRPHRRPRLCTVTYHTLLALLAITGMRVGETCALDSDDVDLMTARITIDHAKLGKSRQIPLHSTTVAALAGYATLRDQLRPHTATAAFFISIDGNRLCPDAADAAFCSLRTIAGIRTPPGRRAPRIHDLRHSMAVTTLLEWYRDGGDVQARLPLLSTWLGHVGPVSTYWYLEAVPELLALAAGRLTEPGTEEWP